MFCFKIQYTSSCGSLQTGIHFEQINPSANDLSSLNYWIIARYYQIKFKIIYEAIFDINYWTDMLKFMKIHNTSSSSCGFILYIGILILGILSMGTTVNSEDGSNNRNGILSFKHVRPFREFMKRQANKHPRDMVSYDFLPYLRRDFGENNPAGLKSIKALRKKFDPKLLDIQKYNKSLKYYIENMDKIRRFCTLMEQFAQGYLVTGDKEYAVQAKRMLLHLSEIPADAGGGLNGCDEIPMSIMQLGPRAYDWIYAALTPDERKKIQVCFRERGNRMWKHIGEGRIVPVNSHKGRMLGFMGEAGIVFWNEFPEAETWMIKTAELVAGDYPKWGGDDGGWAEGPGYWSWYMAHMVNYLYSLYNLIGYNDTLDKPFFKNTTYFGIYCSPLSLPRAPFGDAAEKNTCIVKSSNALFFANIYKNPFFLWYSKQCNRRLSFYELLREPGGRRNVLSQESPDLLPQAKLFESIGWVAMHSKLGNPFDDVFMLFKSSPYGGQSHSHADQNSFVLSAYNMPLTIASGYYNCYGSPHHYGWTRTTKANNTILVNNQGQHPRKGKANVDAFITDGDGSGLTYALGNARGVYDGKLSRALRHVIKLDATNFVLIDEMTAPVPANFSWLLHSLNKMELTPESNSLTVHNGEANCLVKLNSIQGLQFFRNDTFTPPPTMAGGFSTRKKKTCPNQWHFRADTRSKSSNCTITAILNVYEGKKIPAPATIEKYIDDNDRLQMSWQQENKKATITLDKTVQGRLKVMVFQNKKLNRFLMVNDKIMYNDKQLLVKATSPVNISLALISNNICIGLGKGRRGCKIQLKLPADSQIQKLFFRPRGHIKWQPLDCSFKNGFVIFKHPGKDGEINEQELSNLFYSTHSTDTQII